MAVRKMGRTPHDAGRRRLRTLREESPRHRCGARPRSSTVGKASKATSPTRVDMEIAEDRGCQLEDFTVNFVTIRQDHDLAPMLAALPGGMCQCPHWGVMTKGRMTARYRRPRRGVRSGRRVLHASRAHRGRGGRLRVRAVQSDRPARRDRSGHRGGDAATSAQLNGRVRQRAAGPSPGPGTPARRLTHEEVRALESPYTTAHRLPGHLRQCCDPAHVGAARYRTGAVLNLWTTGRTSWCTSSRA